MTASFPDIRMPIAFAIRRPGRPPKPRYWRVGPYIVADDRAGLWCLSRQEMAELGILPPAWPDGRYGWSEPQVRAAIERTRPSWNGVARQANEEAGR